MVHRWPNDANTPCCAEMLIMTAKGTMSLNISRLEYFLTFCYQRTMRHAWGGFSQRTIQHEGHLAFCQSKDIWLPLLPLLINTSLTDFQKCVPSAPQVKRWNSHYRQLDLLSCHCVSLKIKAPICCWTLAFLRRNKTIYYVFIYLFFVSLFCETSAESMSVQSVLVR